MLALKISTISSCILVISVICWLMLRTCTFDWVQNCFFVCTLLACLRSEIHVSLCCRLKGKNACGIQIWPVLSFKLTVVYMWASKKNPSLSRCTRIPFLTSRICSCSLSPHLNMNRLLNSNIHKIQLIETLYWLNVVVNKGQSTTLQCTLYTDFCHFCNTWLCVFMKENGFLL